uniref:Mediator of RNA polymerase II transcription subunit 15 n=1 Tax=Cyanistes caeruleus TaxID=156563 RepID=A0A8C0VQ28_CYACU
IDSQNHSVDWVGSTLFFPLLFFSDEAMRKAGVAHNKSSKDMESHVFMKAKTRVNLYVLPEVIWCQKKFGTNCRNSKASALKSTEFEILISMCCFFYLEGKQGVLHPTDASNWT